MRLYVEVARRTYRRTSTYRSATVAGIFTNTIFGFLLAYVLLAVYRDRDLVGAFDATDAVTFTFVAQGMLMVLGMFTDTEIADRCRAAVPAAAHHRPRSPHRGRHGGRIVARYGGQRTLVVDLAEPGPPLAVSGATVTRVDGPRQWLRFRRDEVSASELLRRVTTLAEVRDLAVEEPDITEIVGQIYRRSAPP